MKVCIHPTFDSSGKIIELLVLAIMDFLVVTAGYGTIGAHQKSNNSIAVHSDF